MLNDREEEDDDLVNEDSQNEEVGDAIHFFKFGTFRGRIFSGVQPFYE